MAFVPRLLLAGALIVLTGCAQPRIGAPVELSRPVTLAAVSWNLDAGRGTLPQLVDDLVAGALLGSSPREFVLLLQETDERTVADFAAARGLSFAFAPTRPQTPRRGNAILSTLRLQSARAIELPRERQPRSAVSATVELEGQPIFVVSVHLENRVSWWRGGLSSDIARGRQASALLSALPAGPGLVGGDLNTWLGPSEPAWRMLAERFPDTPPEAAPTFADRLPLDHVFLDVPAGWRTARLVVPGSYGSNHRPVAGLVFVP